MNCPVCQKEFDPYTGRRPKKYCSDTCKVFYFNAQKLLEKNKGAIKEINNDLVDFGAAVFRTDQEGAITRIDPMSRKADIVAQIAAIRAEKIPKERDTPMGRKFWNLDQEKRIKPLMEELKALV